MDIPRRVLSDLVARGELIRTGRGVYVPADLDASEHHSLATASVRVPAGVVCLLSALRFHGLTTQNPWEVWLAISPDARKPRVDSPPLRIARFSGGPLTEGIETHRIDGVEVRIYSAAKTVADCFRYRNKIGLDVALEALRDGWRSRKFTADQLWHFANVCRVATVMRPYMESVAA